MSHPIPNPFTSYHLSDDEQVAGSLLNSLQIAVLQNKRAEIASQKLQLEFTPNDVLSFTQQEAYLKGQLDMVSYILDAHEATTSLSISKPQS